MVSPRGHEGGPGAGWPGGAGPGDAHVVGDAAHLPGRRCAVLILLSSSEEHTECRRALTEKTGQVVAVGSDLGAGTPCRRNLRRGPMGSGVQLPLRPPGARCPDSSRTLEHCGSTDSGAWRVTGERVQVPPPCVSVEHS